MDELGWLEGVVRPFATEISGSHLSQLVVDLGQRGIQAARVEIIAEQPLRKDGDSSRRVGFVLQFHERDILRFQQAACLRLQRNLKIS